MTSTHSIRTTAMPDLPFAVMGGHEKDKTYAIGDPDKMEISFPNSGIIITKTGEVYFRRIFGSLSPGKYTWFIPPTKLTDMVKELHATQKLLDSGKKSSGYLFKVDLNEKRETLKTTIIDSLKNYFAAIKTPNQAQRTEFFLANGTPQELYAAARSGTQ